jgi:hypothetical protein
MKAKYKDKAKMLWDEFEISGVRCPKCQCYKPRVVLGSEVTCDICQHKFKVVEEE